METDVEQVALLADTVELTRRLVRFDTTYPPGGTAACVAYVEELLAGLGLATRILASDPARPNLVATMPGRGVAPPLVLHAHADVVPVAGQRWSRDPFGGELIGGEVWGRGTVDMKGGLAMMLTALYRLRTEGTRPAGDVILAVVADEEVGSRHGAGYLVREHPELFRAARYAVGEEGGAGLDLAGRARVHPVVVAEKRACWLRVTLRGPGGHASRVAAPDSAVRLMTTASTDARLFAGLGLATFGWTPMLLPPGASHRWLLHSADERIPAAALRFGADCLTTLLRRYR